MFGLSRVILKRRPIEGLLVRQDTHIRLRADLIVHPQEQGMAPYERVMEDKKASCRSIKNNRYLINEYSLIGSFVVSLEAKRKPPQGARGSRSGAKVPEEGRSLVK